MSRSDPKFCTAISCMDGRIQIPVNTYLQRKFQAANVDTITEPGPCRILIEKDKLELLESIMSRLKISLERHASTGVALVIHPDCAGNPVADDLQKSQLKKALDVVRSYAGSVPVIGLWVKDNTTVQELS